MNFWAGFPKNKNLKNFSVISTFALVLFYVLLPATSRAVVLQVPVSSSVSTSQNETGEIFLPPQAGNNFEHNESRPLQIKSTVYYPGSKENQNSNSSFTELNLEDNSNGEIIQPLQTIKITCSGFWSCAKQKAMSLFNSPRKNIGSRHIGIGRWASDSLQLKIGNWANSFYEKKDLTFGTKVFDDYKRSSFWAKGARLLLNHPYIPAVTAGSIVVTAWAGAASSGAGVFNVLRMGVSESLPFLATGFRAAGVYLGSISSKVINFVKSKFNTVITKYVPGLAGLAGGAFKFIKSSPLVVAALVVGITAGTMLLKGNADGAKTLVKDYTCVNFQIFCDSPASAAEPDPNTTPGANPNGETKTNPPAILVQKDNPPVTTEASNPACSDSAMCRGSTVDQVKISPTGVIKSSDSGNGDNKQSESNSNQDAAIPNTENNSTINTPPVAAATVSDSSNIGTEVKEGNSSQNSEVVKNETGQSTSPSITGTKSLLETLKNTPAKVLAAASQFLKTTGAQLSHPFSPWVGSAAPTKTSGIVWLVALLVSALLIGLQAYKTIRSKKFTTQNLAS